MGAGYKDEDLTVFRGFTESISPYLSENVSRDSRVISPDVLTSSAHPRSLVVVAVECVRTLQPLKRHNQIWHARTPTYSRGATEST